MRLLIILIAIVFAQPHAGGPDSQDAIILQVHFNEVPKGKQFKQFVQEL